MRTTCKNSEFIFADFKDTFCGFHSQIVTDKACFYSFRFRKSKSVKCKFYTRTLQKKKKWMSIFLILCIFNRNMKFYKCSENKISNHHKSKNGVKNRTTKTNSISSSSKVLHIGTNTMRRDKFGQFLKF